MGQEMSLEEAFEQFEAASAAFAAADEKIAAMAETLAKGPIKTIADLRAKSAFLLCHVKGDKGMIDDEALRTLDDGVAFIMARATEMGVHL